MAQRAGPGRVDPGQVCQKEHVFGVSFQSHCPPRWAEVGSSGVQLGRCHSVRARSSPEVTVGQALPKSQKGLRVPVTAVPSRHAFDFVGETGGLEIRFHSDPLKFG